MNVILSWIKIFRPDYIKSSTSYWWVVRGESEATGLAKPHLALKRKGEVSCTVKSSLPLNLGTNVFTCLPKHGSSLSE